jgi:hypothetical protein
MDYSKIGILVAVPCYGAQMHSYTASSLFSLSKLLTKKNIACDIITPSNESFIPSTRNHIAASFLDLGYTHLLCIDADIQFRPKDVLVLLDMDVEFAAAPYRLKKWQKVELCVNPCEETTDEPITKVNYVGAGFNLIKKSVFEKLNKVTTLIHGPNRILIHDYYSPYIDNENKLLVHEDAAFGMRWRKIGGDIWINRNIKLGHYGGISYLTD